MSEAVAAERRDVCDTQRQTVCHLQAAQHNEGAVCKCVCVWTAISEYIGELMSAQHVYAHPAYTECLGVNLHCAFELCVSARAACQCKPRHPYRYSHEKIPPARTWP